MFHLSLAVFSSIFHKQHTHNVLSFFSSFSSIFHKQYTHNVLSLTHHLSSFFSRFFIFLPQTRHTHNISSIFIHILLQKRKQIHDISASSFIQNPKHSFDSSSSESMTYPSKYFFTIFAHHLYSNPKHSFNSFSFIFMQVLHGFPSRKNTH